MTRDANKQSVKRCEYNHRWIETTNDNTNPTGIKCSRCAAIPKTKEINAAEAEVRLRSWIKPGDTLYTKLQHVSRSGMQRVIQVIKIECSNGEPSMSYLGYNIAQALGDTYDRDRDGVKVGGCGMDMGFSLVYNLSHHLFGDGYKCLGKGKCPSNYHSNFRSSLNCPNNCRFDPETRLRVYYREKADDDYEETRSECTTCERGYIPNTEKESFRLVHTDGYAINHKWI